MEHAAELAASVPSENVSFNYPHPGSEAGLTPSNPGFRPSSENTGLPSTSSSHPTASDEHEQTHAGSSTFVTATQAAPATATSAARAKPSSRHAGNGTKRPRTGRAVALESDSEDGDGQGNTAVHRLRGPDGNASQLYVFFPLWHRRAH